MTIVRKKYNFFFCLSKIESRAKMYNFRITKGEILVVNYAVLGRKKKGRHQIPPFSQE